MRPLAGAGSAPGVFQLSLKKMEKYRKTSENVPVREGFGYFLFIFFYLWNASGQYRRYLQNIAEDRRYFAPLFAQSR